MTDSQLLGILLLCCLISFLLGRYLAFIKMQKKLNKVEAFAKMKGEEIDNLRLLVFKMQEKINKKT